MNAIEFENISMRARVAFGILCLENAIKYYQLDHLNWSFINKLLWSYTNSNVGRWHEIMSEATPFGVLGETEYLDDLDNISVEEFRQLEDLYKRSNNEINKIIDFIFNIGTRDLYAAIVNGSPDTLKYIQRIIDIMCENNIELPNVRLFDKFSINENQGWGKEFIKEDIFQ